MEIQKNAFFIFIIFLFFTSPLFATAPITTLKHQVGNALPNLTEGERAFFEAGKETFLEVTSVQGTEPGAQGKGLGPRFNLNSCASCHFQPLIGGSSPAVNPQVGMATQFGAANKVPFFIKIDGPIREVRFKYQMIGKNLTAIRDGSAHGVYVITGRGDALGCNIDQPDFEAAASKNNLAFRIPTPIFGGGLIEQIPDSVILANKQNNQALKAALGIGGHTNRNTSSARGDENRSQNDGTITRFGWKAQNKSLEIFAAEAYNVEQGVTSELFPQERDDTPGCLFNGLPEDHTHFEETSVLDSMSEIGLLAHFMRFLAPPAPLPPTPETQHGSELFVSVGCALCHTPTLMTGKAASAALSNQPVNLYSDLLVHAMGPGLADDIIQGLAGPDEFRTAPLWGLGQRLFFLHDGRATNLHDAIIAHASTKAGCKGKRDENGIACKSEANKVIDNFNKLSANDKQSLIKFLQSL